MTTHGREFLANHLPLWHGPRARRGKGVYADDLAHPSEAQAKAETKDAAGMEELQAPETSCNESSPASSKRADNRRSLEGC